MKCVAWNVRELGNSMAFRGLADLKRSFDPDIVFLMETKAENSTMEICRVRLGFSSKLSVDKIGRSGGLGMFWSDRVDVELLSYSRFHIDVKVVSHMSKIWRLTGFYGDPDPEQKHHTWTLLHRLQGFSDLPWLCFGDFNEILEDAKKEGGRISPR
ncbi:hypothetical protein Dsin_015069 [Dipteronia sinensis]|uniref:Endonuclease/exonuclease/phosphatase domain-containing protein n=1 Tax=Dipteronia sinensis TaxID=43782 RepID=A0AAE0AP89_9ROSI|nr:hypothetical protein Dsin_015069 [Dipteronia sinensis]